MRIAVIGTGISGLTAAWLLHREHEVTLFEAEDRIGGHTHTHDVNAGGVTTTVDTGFIVCNDRTYPNFLALMQHLGVALRPTTMTFSARVEADGLEWAGTNLNALFAQRRNLFRFSFLRMVREILRFHREGLELLHDGDEESLGSWLARRGYHREFIDHYIVPMGGAIWSSPPRVMLEFPARFFVRFFHHHGMMTVDDRPQWFTVVGGSRSYLAPLTAPFSERIRRGCPVTGIFRGSNQVRVATPVGEEPFDAVVMACHADTALALLREPTPAESEVLSAFPYQANQVVLHTDPSLMPHNRRCWSAWNAHVLDGREAAVAVTYDMHALQGLTSPERLFVTLNYDRFDPRRVLKRLNYRHPLFTRDSPAAQERHGEINGVDRVYFAGAYWRWGFHEDGVRSALAAVAPLTSTRIPGAP
jgi:predicted NAD/FAD-binding protein